MELESIDWARENVSNIRFVAWDTETTGSNPKSDHLVEIAAIAFDEEFEHRSFQTLVKPPCLIPESAIAIHGIQNAMVADAPSSAATIEDFCDFLDLSGSPRVLLAHNAGFDINVLMSESARSLDKKMHQPEFVLDTCMMAKLLVPELPNHKLITLIDHFKINIHQHHRAMDDVKAVQALFLKLLEIASDYIDIDQEGFTLEKLVNLIGGYFIMHLGDKSSKDAFHYSPKLKQLQALCGTDKRVTIVYGADEDCRQITPIDVRVRGFKIYVDAICHRDNLKKTFRADRIIKVGPMN